MQGAGLPRGLGPQEPMGNGAQGGWGPRGPRGIGVKGPKGPQGAQRVQGEWGHEFRPVFHEAVAKKFRPWVLNLGWLRVYPFALGV